MLPYLLKKNSKYSAEDSLLGYIYQLRYALYLILQQQGSTKIFIEKTDDVELDSIKTKELVQVKHHQGSTKLNDRSIDLWKTINNWIDQHGGCLDNKKFFLITTSKISNQSLAAQLGIRDRNPDKALSKMIKISAEMNQDGDKEKSIIKYYEIFRNLGQYEKNLLVNNIFIIGDFPNIYDIVEKIKDQLRYSTRPQFTADLYQQLEGWWIGLVIDHLKSKIDIDNYRVRLKINDLQEQFLSDNLPVIEPPVDLEIMGEQRMFIRQLRLIEVSDTRVAHAKLDYYRANINRQNWVDLSPNNADKIEDYDDELFDAWKLRFDIMKEKILDFGNEDQIIQMGKDLFNEIVTNVDINILPAVRRKFIMRGSYHILSDQLVLGWHVNYQNILGAS